MDSSPSQTYQQPESKHAACSDVMNLFVSKKYQECLQSIEKKLSESGESDFVQLKILQAGCWTHLNAEAEDFDFRSNEKVVKQFEEILKYQPRNSFAHYGLGLNFYLRGEFEMCLEPFSKAHSFNPACMQRAYIYKNYAIKVIELFKEARIAHIAGCYTKAIEVLSLATLVDPENKACMTQVKSLTNEFLSKLVVKLESDVLADDNTEGALNRIEFLVKNGKFEAAYEMLPLEELLCGRGFCIRGIIKYYLGAVKMSSLDFAKALDMNPECKDAKEYKNKADTFGKMIDSATDLMKKNNNEEAIVLLTKALPIDPSNSRLVQLIYFQRAACRFFLGQTSKAFEDYLIFESFQDVTGIKAARLK